MAHKLWHIYVQLIFQQYFYHKIQHVNVTNANGEGCKLVEFPKYTLQALKNGPNEYFLDSTTGDMYLYNKATDEWLPRANTGIHNRRDA